ncbi:MAG: tRNA (adenosine(37)-N6)-threonylcarbamoyltransferase complex dimerization subunit type 1 TsaB [Bacteroidetes bacterium B1(2017)]|nr:MAG: tRNA (adenosine(37)-N6)-threonylcarbamoyltransferase complex dimerization subunit type 1 TsaB [Bacteroidetes bacterium B1(2017)]
MALILGIETATEVCSVALGKDGTCIAEQTNREGNTHASQLHKMVENILKETGYTFNNLNAIAVSKGPGSYTGLRVGVSAAKGFGYALNIPVIGISTLKSLCAQVLGRTETKGELLVPMIDARRMEVFTAIFSQKLEEIESTNAKIIEENMYVDLLETQKILFFGNGSEKCKKILEHKNATFIDNLTCNATSLLGLAEEMYQNNEFENLAYFEPFYLKDFVGTTPKNKK